MKLAFPAPLTRRAATVLNRRRSLHVLTATVAAVAMLPFAAPASTKNRKKKGKGNGQRTNLCLAQQSQCLGVIPDFCAERTVKRLAAAPSPLEDCITQFNPCCDFFAVCDTTGGLDCLSNRKAPA